MEWKEMTRIILEYFSIPLFGSFNGGNEKPIPLFGSLRLRLGVYKRIEWNGHNGMEMNGMKWNVFK